MNLIRNTNLSSCCFDVTLGIMKYLLCFINFLVIVPGIALIVSGVLLQSLFTDYYGTFFQDVVNCAAITVIVVGSITLAIGVSGCLGAMLSSRWLLLTYGVLMIVIIIAQTAYGIVLLTKVDGVKEYVDSELNTAFNETYVNNQTGSELYGFIQDEFNCCGIDGPKDFLPVFPDGSVPLTCCGGGFFVTSCNQVTAYTRGCVNPLSEYLSGLVAGVGGIIMAMAVIELIPTAVGFSLAHRYRVRLQPFQAGEVTTDPNAKLLQNAQVEDHTLGTPFAEDEKDWGRSND